MKLDIEFPELERLREKMGAPKVVWNPPPPGPRPEPGPRGPINVPRISAVKVGSDGGLMIHGKKVILYIVDSGRTKEDAESYKYHISNCMTLVDMRDKGRYGRYVAYYIRNDMTEKFEIRWTDENGEEQEGEAALKVCKHCLGNLNYKGYRDYRAKSAARQKIFDEFSLKDFFNKFGVNSQKITELPLYTAKTMPSNKYRLDMNAISRAYCAKKNWTCEEKMCGIYLGEKEKNQELMHCHHINGRRWDNREVNLMALCCACHAKQPKHGWMKIKPKKYFRLSQIRREQGIPDPSYKQSLLPE